MIVGWLPTPTADDLSQVTRRILPDTMNMTAHSSDHLSPHTNRGHIQQRMRIRPGRALYNMVSAGNG